MKKKFCGFLAFIMLAWLLVACGEDTPEIDHRPYPSLPPNNDALATVVAKAPLAQKLTLGITAPWEGTDYYGGQRGDGGAGIAAENYNRQGGVTFNGVSKYINLVAPDDSSRPDGVAAAVTKMVNEDDVLAFIGPFAAEGLAPNLQLVKALATPELLMQTSPSLLDKTSQNSYLFYLRPLDQYWAAAMVDYLAGSGAFKPGLRLGVVSQQNDEGQVGLTELKKALGAKHVTSSFETTVPNYDKKLKDTKQYADVVKSLVAANPDLLISWSNTDETIELLTELRAGGWKGQLVTTSLSDQLVFKLKDMAEGVIGPVTWAATATDAESQKFTQEYEAYFHVVPDDHAAAVYDGLRMLVEAYKQVGYDKAKVRDWLAGVKGWTGLQGSYTAQPDGEMITSVKMAQIKNGQVVIVGTGV